MHSVKNAQRIVDRFKLVYFAVFLAVAGGTGLYWMFYQRPEAACERSGNWWDPQTRQCGTVVYIPDLTGRYRIDGREYRPTVQGQRVAPGAAGQPAAATPSA